MQSTNAPAAPGVVRTAAVRAARETAYLAMGLVTSVLAPRRVGRRALAVAVADRLRRWPAGRGRRGDRIRWTADSTAATPRGCCAGRSARAYLELGRGLRGLLGSTLGDPQAWRDLVWLVLHSVIGFVFGWLALAAVFGVLAIASCRRRIGRCRTASRTSGPGAPTRCGTRSRSCRSPFRPRS
jgi:hypothetical protein